MIFVVVVIIVQWTAAPYGVQLHGWIDRFLVRQLRAALQEKTTTKHVYIFCTWRSVCASIISDQNFAITQTSYRAEIQTDRYNRIFRLVLSLRSTSLVPCFLPLNPEGLENGEKKKKKVGQSQRVFSGSATTGSLWWGWIDLSQVESKVQELEVIKPLSMTGIYIPSKIKQLCQVSGHFKFLLKF